MSVKYRLFDHQIAKCKMARLDTNIYRTAYTLSTQCPICSGCFRLLMSALTLTRGSFWLSYLSAYSIVLFLKRRKKRKMTLEVNQVERIPNLTLMLIQATETMTMNTSLVQKPYQWTFTRDQRPKDQTGSHLQYHPLFLK